MFLQCQSATMSGLSLSASTSFKDLTLRAALDIQNAIDDTTGKRLVRRSKQHGTLAAEYSLNQAKIGVETVFADARFENPLNTVTLPGYALLNVYATYDFAGNWSALARLNNALNKDYELAKNYTMAGSNFYLGLKYGFK